MQKLNSPKPIKILYVYFLLIGCIVLFSLKQRVIKNKFYQKSTYHLWMMHKFNTASLQQKSIKYSESYKYQHLVNFNIQPQQRYFYPKKRTKSSPCLFGRLYYIKKSERYCTFSIINLSLLDYQ